MSEYKDKLLELAESFRMKTHYADDHYCCPASMDENDIELQCVCGKDYNNDTVDDLITLIQQLVTVGEVDENG